MLARYIPVPILKTKFWPGWISPLWEVPKATLREPQDYSKIILRFPNIPKAYPKITPDYPQVSQAVLSLSWENLNLTLRLPNIS